MRRFSLMNRPATDSDENIAQASGLSCTNPNTNQPNLLALQSLLKRSDHLPFSLWPRRQSEITSNTSWPFVSNHSPARQHRFSISSVNRMAEESIEQQEPDQQRIDRTNAEKSMENFNF